MASPPPPTRQGLTLHGSVGSQSVSRRIPDLFALIPLKLEAMGIACGTNTGNSPSLEESGHDRHHSGQCFIIYVPMLCGVCAVIRDFDIKSLYE
jgi:hypothetical protein